MLLVLIAATALLLHTALSDHEVRRGGCPARWPPRPRLRFQGAPACFPPAPPLSACALPPVPHAQDPGLHVVAADGGGGAAGRTQLLEQPGEQQPLFGDGAGVKVGQQGGGAQAGGALFGTGEAAKQDGAEQQQEAGSEQQQQGRGQEQQEDGQQLTQGGQQQGQGQEQPGKRSPSKFAQALQRQREEAGSADAGSAAAVKAKVPTEYPPQPEPAAEELSPEEVARCGCGLPGAVPVPVRAWRSMVVLQLMVGPARAASPRGALTCPAPPPAQAAGGDQAGDGARVARLRDVRLGL